MATILCLFVVVWVAVDVVQDDHIGRGEVNAQPPCLGGKQEHKDVLIRVELVDQANPGVRTERRRDQKKVVLMVRLCKLKLYFFLMHLQLCQSHPH